MKIRKNDTVLIISGKDRGKKAKVLEVFREEGKATVEGINIKKKHVKPKKSGEKGQIVQMPSPVDVSNLKLICNNCGKPARLGYKIIREPGKKANKVRICKKCGQPV
jgi:large subunit ribosomal protein L24